MLHFRFSPKNIQLKWPLKTGSKQSYKIPFTFIHKVESSISLFKRIDHGN